MRRRFGRGRGKGGAESKTPSLDTTRIFAQIIESGITSASSLAVVESTDVPGQFAAIAEGTDRNGGAVLVGFAPRSGADAALAVVAEAERRFTEGFTGEVVAVAPQWSDADRRLLALLSPQRYRLQALAASALADPAVRAQAADGAALFPAKQLGATLPRGNVREVFLRALAAFEGLAAKHGGAVRGAGSRIELVVLARCAAVLTVREASAGREAGVVLETILPERSSEALDLTTLATALDRLEGLLRKRLNDRRIRSGEEGQRGTLAALLAASAEVRSAVLWPLGGSDPDVIDFAGVAEDGQPVLGAVREQMTLPAFGAILDATTLLRVSLPVLFADLQAAWRVTAPRLVLAANGYDASVLRVVAALALDADLYDVAADRGRSPNLVLRAVSDRVDLSEAPTGEPAAPREARKPREPRAPREPRTAREGRDVEDNGERPGADGEAEPRRDRAPNRRRRRGGSRSSGGNAEGGSSDDAARSAAAAPAGSVETARARGSENSKEHQFDDFSLFDSEDELRPSEESASGTRRRRRRGRRRPGEGSDEASERDAKAPSGPEAGRKDGSRDSAAAKARHEPALAAADDDDDTVDEISDLADILAEVDDEPDPDARPERSYDDDEEASEEASPAVGRSPYEAPEETKRARPRRRAAILVHADRASVLSGVLLARDLRLIEGIWIYGQADLMTFFRSIAIDLGNDTPIHVVGFNALPAREVLQAASLYADRLDWYDHHDWPPEDLGALRGMIGADRVHVFPGMANPLAAVLSDSTRRSRFSDKLVELLTGRFSDHDYERWGRYWWHRLGEIAAGHGDRRADLDPLLVGRPSDLAREAALLPVPAFPPEVEYVSARDFRIVHFGGYTLVVVPTPSELDECLAARIARERYSAQLSLAFHDGQETLSLGAEEGGGRGSRGFNLSTLVDHLASKHTWIEALPDEDRVASLRVRDLWTVAGRLDEIVREIAMGRSLFEN